MPKYRNSLPQSEGRLCLADGGIETTLIFHEGLELPYFAAFVLLKTPEGRSSLERYFATYAKLAQQRSLPLLCETVTWRCSTDWGAQLGYSPDQIAMANRAAVDWLVEFRQQFETDETPVVISGNLGPRGDGYRVEQAMTVQQAQDYHTHQLAVFADSEADMACGLTMNYTAEAIGVAQAAKGLGLPVSISFTVETDGTLPSGESLPAAIEAVDTATGGFPCYYMINCAHPTHFESTLTPGADWLSRIGGIRANASRMSHAELDEATELDAGDPAELAQQYAALKERLPNLSVLGGCCGTDHRHIEAIADACATSSGDA